MTCLRFDQVLLRFGLVALADAFLLVVEEDTDTGRLTLLVRLVAAAAIMLEEW